MLPAESSKELRALRQNACKLGWASVGLASSMAAIGSPRKARLSGAVKRRVDAVGHGNRHAVALLGRIENEIVGLISLRVATLPDPGALDAFLNCLVCLLGCVFFIPETHLQRPFRVGQHMALEQAV